MSAPYGPLSGLRILDLTRILAGEVDLIASPVKMSATPVTYRRPPPTLGQHTDEVLAELLSMDEAERTRLREKDVI